MNKVYTVRVDATLNIGGDNGDLTKDFTICTGSYTTGDLASVINCADKVTSEAEETFKHIGVPVINIYCTFIRDDGTIIDKCNISEFENANDFIQKYFIV